MPFRRFTSPGVHWVWVSMILYAASCFLPAMGGFLGGAPVSGWECLVSFIYFIPAWWANPAYFVSLILCWCRRRRAAACFAGAAAVLACSFELMGVPNRGWMAALGQQEIGCYVWIASIQILACNLVWQEWLARRKRRAQLEIG